ncbi:MAG: ATP-binding cassette domain-containing protein [Erysipelotrichaceae bacterium]|nr:ATP-binding cassette domain-containing protein [Erysipelotrichaceae bacterium]
MLELKHITKKFQERVILDNISITLPDHGLIGIQGESGCGKSTLLYIIGCSIKILMGKYFITMQSLMIIINLLEIIFHI